MMDENSSRHTARCILEHYLFSLSRPCAVLQTRPGSEGGQTALYRRLPKYVGKPMGPGHTHTQYNLIKLEELNGCDEGATVSFDSLFEAGSITKSKQKIHKVKHPPPPSLLVLQPELWSVSVAYIFKPAWIARFYPLELLNFSCALESGGGWHGVLG